MQPVGEASRPIPNNAASASPASRIYREGSWPRNRWEVHPEDAALPLPTWWTPLTTARFVRPSLVVSPVTSREGGRLYVALCAGASASVVTAARDRLEQDHATHRFERAALTPELRCEVCGGLRRAIVHQLESGEVITPEQWRQRGKPRSLTRTAECWNCGGDGE